MNSFPKSNFQVTFLLIRRSSRSYIFFSDKTVGMSSINVLTLFNQLFSSVYFPYFLISSALFILLVVITLWCVIKFTAFLKNAVASELHQQTPHDSPTPILTSTPIPRPRHRCYDNHATDHTSFLSPTTHSDSQLNTSFPITSFHLRKPWPDDMSGILLMSKLSLIKVASNLSSSVTPYLRLLWVITETS